MKKINFINYYTLCDYKKEKDKVDEWIAVIIDCN